MYTTPPEEITSVLLELVRDNVPETPIDIDRVLAFEGAPMLRTRFVRERDRTVVSEKIASVLSTGNRLSCECCGFDFEKVFGALGEGFCEVHHIKPIGGRTQNEPTRIGDLAVVCSNCHRMLHRKPALTIQKLRAVIAANDA